MNASSDIGIIIVTYNPEINKLKEQLLKLKSDNLNIVIVNNGENFDLIEVPVINLKRNEGIATAQNVGVNFLKENTDVKYLFFFDQDSVFDAQFLGTMLNEWDRLAKVDFNIGILSPNLIDKKSNNFLAINQICGKKIVKVYLTSKTIQEISNTLPISSGIMISLDVYDQIGGLDDKLFIDWVDLDLDFRVLDAGYNIYTTVNAQLYHSIGKSSEKSLFLKKIHPFNYPLFREFYFSRNAVYSYKKYSKKFPGIKKLVYKSLLFRIITAFYEDHTFSRLKVIFRGILCGLMNKFNLYNAN